MRFWKINFIIDTAYEWLEREWVIIADNETSALKNSERWISPQLHGEKFVEDSQTQIEEIQANDYGIIYQNCFKNNR